MKIYVDDERKPPRGWTHTDNAKDTKTILCSGIRVTDISLDHDLGDYETYGNGYDIIVWIEEMAFREQWDRVPDNIHIHTANPVGEAKMRAALENIERFREEQRGTEA